MPSPSLKPLPQNIRKKLEKEKQRKKSSKGQFLTEELTNHAEQGAVMNLVDDLGIDINPTQNFRQHLQIQKSNSQKNILPVTPQSNKSIAKQVAPSPAQIANIKVDIRQQPIAVQVNVQNRQNQLTPFARQLTPQLQKKNNEQDQEKKVSIQKDQNQNYKIYQPQINNNLNAIRNFVKPQAMPAKPQSSTSTFEADGKQYTQKRTFS
jgi:hypothetical protein